MKYFIDTEFHEYEKNGISTIDLISIAIVDENERNFYQLNKQHNLEDSWSNEWLKENVFKQIYNELMPISNRENSPFCFSTMSLLFNNYGLDKNDIKQEILSFIKFDKNIEFYGYFSDYDWVVFCWLFGRMIDLPNEFPQYCVDLKQMMKERNLSNQWKEKNCPTCKNEHSAVEDAKWNLQLYKKIIENKI